MELLLMLACTERVGEEISLHLQVRYLIDILLPVERRLQI